MVLLLRKGDWNKALLKQRSFIYALSFIFQVMKFTKKLKNQNDLKQLKFYI